MSAGERILEWAALTGLPLDDAAMADRIAAGASAAIEAVRTVQCALALNDPPAQEPADYLACLERWAEPRDEEAG